MDKTSQSDTKDLKPKTSKWEKFVTFLSCGGFILVLIAMGAIAIFIDSFSK